MVIFLHGEDAFLVGRRKQALQSAFMKKYPEAEIFTFDFEDQGSVTEVGKALSFCEPGLFLAEKMIVLFHPFALGESPEKSLRAFLKERAKSLPKQTILLVVHAGKLKKAAPLTKALLSCADTIETYDVPEGRSLRTLLEKELAFFNSQVRFQPRALELLLSCTGGDTGRLFSEVNKLASFRDAGEISEEDVRLLVALPEENVLFDALDALGRGNRKQALLFFRNESQRGGGVFPLLSMCAWQLRRILLVREAYDRGVRRPSDIAAAVHLPPFTVQKALATLDHLTPSRLKRGLILLSDIDTALKQGKADPEASLDIFVWKF